MFKENLSLKLLPSSEVSEDKTNFLVLQLDYVCRSGSFPQQVHTEKLT